MKWPLEGVRWIVALLAAAVVSLVLGMALGTALRAACLATPAELERLALKASDGEDTYVLASSAARRGRTAAAWRDRTVATATVAGPVRQVLDVVINDPNGGWIVVGCTAWVEAGPPPYNHHVSIKVANNELDGACEKLHASIGAWVVMRARILGCCFTLGSPGCVPGCDRVDLQATAVEFGGRRRDR